MECCLAEATATDFLFLFYKQASATNLKNIFEDLDFFFKITAAEKKICEPLR